jgi:hypothetical protein
VRARDTLRRGERPPSSAGRFHRRARLNKRIAQLEQEVQELRRLSQRLAELTDVVEELLVPAASRDDERVRKLLDRYDPGR